MTDTATTTPAAPPPLFGRWFACSDGRAHYRLGETMLCGGPTLLTTGAPLTKVSDSGARVVLVPNCKTCLQRNWTRWANNADRNWVVYRGA